MYRFAIPMIVMVLSLAPHVRAQSNDVSGINVLLAQPPDAEIVAALALHGEVLEIIPEINGVTLRAHSSALSSLRALPFVLAASPDMLGSLTGGGEPPMADFSGGASHWCLDAVNVTDVGGARTIDYDGAGVDVAIIDTGLVGNWRAYLPEPRVAVAHARAFGGGGGNRGTISSQPDKWEHDTLGHGTAVASVILGFRYTGMESLPAVFDGVAPRADIIPIRVHTFQGGSNVWSSVVTHALIYVTRLKTQGELGDHRLVVNLSLGYAQADPMLLAAVDYAIANGVVVVAAGGNEGDAGMFYPAAYAPVISCAASSWVGAFPSDDPSLVRWIMEDVSEGDPLAHYIAPFSSRALPGQDLDVAAPGLLVPAPWSCNGQVDYTFAVGTSFSCPHVAGAVTLMLQKNPTLSQAQIESILESTAMPLSPGCRDVTLAGSGPGNCATWGDPNNVFFFNTTFCWGGNATGAGLVQADAALAATPLP